MVVQQCKTMNKFGKVALRLALCLFFCSQDKLVRSDIEMRSHCNHPNQISVSNELQKVHDDERMVRKSAK